MVDLKEDFELAAEWQRAVAVEHPNDSRNLKAAAMLDQLAETVAAINPNVLATYQEIFEGGPGDDIGFHALEDKREMMSRIGFHYFPATAEEFVGILFQDTQETAESAIQRGEIRLGDSRIAVRRCGLHERRNSRLAASHR